MRVSFLFGKPQSLATDSHNLRLGTAAFGSAADGLFRNWYRLADVQKWMIERLIATPLRPFAVEFQYRKQPSGRILTMAADADLLHTSDGTIQQPQAPHLQG